ncbi:uncharacterized protein [Physcomitrium patens]|uniref:Uncharacterized protein n=1 Tax=Physcomitrium patens TaxID=3218 RepID=A0A2K1J2V8_PHYPA|nr:uncharacterized protein LOC112294388 [Physcomitrium patens]PNR35856.1 hypothetical protein PHYPA_021706 [Physcomitrium patens]|eukprot:XP_024400487.1 uncharacterized protein LOC112294388 [Physcomitrella patens]
MTGGEDEGIEKEACVGSLCFVQPHPLYLPPPFYGKLIGQEYRWKIGAKLSTGPGLQLKLQRAITLPNFLGLDKDARWRWQHIPLSIKSGVKVDTRLDRQESAGDNSLKSSGIKTIRLLPHFCIKSKSSIFGTLALRPIVEVVPAPTLTVQRRFSVGATTLTLRVNFEVPLKKGPSWSVQFNWLKDATKLVVEPVKGGFDIHYSKTLRLSEGSKAVAAGSARAPLDFLSGEFSSRKNSLPLQFRSSYLKISQIFGTRALRDTPKSAFVYREAAKSIGEEDIISVVPGHWIDCSSEPGAHGEREFNMDVANVLEKELRKNGWEVLRPDRDAPQMQWEEYLNWVSKQSSKGIPVLEIHGQGSNADYRGHVLGVIGDYNVPLSKELAQTFGEFQMDWRELGVPRRGGVIVESFNADEVVQMKPWQRTWAARRLSNQIVSAIERASAPNRKRRGLVVDLDAYKDASIERSAGANRL